MLDVDEYSLKELFNVSYTHTIYHICLLWTWYGVGKRHHACLVCASTTVWQCTTALSNWYNVAACVVVLWSQSLYLLRMTSQRGHWVCWMSTSTRWRSGLTWSTVVHTPGIISVCCLWCRQMPSCLPGVLHSMLMWATIVHHEVYVNYYSTLPISCYRSSDVRSRLGC